MKRTNDRQTDLKYYNTKITTVVEFALKKCHAVFDQCYSFLSRADSVYEDMKQRYGSQGCYLLKMNSRTFSAEEDEQIPDPWSQYLQRNNLQNQVNAVASTTCSDWPWSKIIPCGNSHLQLWKKRKAKLTCLWQRITKERTGPMGKSQPVKKVCQILHVIIMYFIWLQQKQIQICLFKNTGK